MKDILAEVKLLAKSGVIEIIFIAQDTTVYPKLPLLLKKAAKIDKIKWLRLLYAHPAHATDELIETIATEKKIVKYLDLPIQHVSDKILNKMNRHYSRSDLEQLISKIRRRVPKIALRSSVIVGFPGEGSQEFNELLSFVKEARFERLGVFCYSREEGTPAYNMRGQVPEREKNARLNRIMRQQAKISLEKNKKMIGQIIEVLIENNNQGRSCFDAPEIDGSVLVQSTKKLTLGRIVKVCITGAKTYDLVGCLT